MCTIFRYFFMSLVATLFLLPLGFSSFGRACTNATVQNLVRGINFYSEFGDERIESAIKNALNLCTSNLFYFGQQVGREMEPYRPERVAKATQKISQLTDRLPDDLLRGLGLTLIGDIDTYHPEALRSYTDLILEFGTHQPSVAKEFALRILERRNSSYPDESAYLQQAADQLVIAANDQSDLLQGETRWAFAIKKHHCTTRSHYLGRPTYFPCQKVEASASMSDSKGNRLLLICNQRDHGIQLVLKAGIDLKRKLYGNSIFNMTLATETRSQSLGEIHYLTPHDYMYPKQIISYEVLEALSHDSQVSIAYSLNDGESHTDVRFSLKGSLGAIDKVIKACHRD